MNKSLPTRALREHPDLDQLRCQAKELLAAFAAGEPDIVAEVNTHYHGADPANFALHDAQLVIARSYGFDSWPKLKAYVDGVTITRLAEAIRAGDVARVRAMIDARPELVNTDMAENDEHRAIHYAVLARWPEMVRLLMEQGADARKGIYPHRDATGALTMAIERGYEEIVAIIREEEQRRAAQLSGTHAAVVSAADELAETIRTGDEARAIAFMEREPALVHACDRKGWTPLHTAAGMLDESLAAWLLDHGAEVNHRGPGDRTPLDVACRGWSPAREFAGVVRLLREHGAVLTSVSAVALDEAEWLRARHAEGALHQSKVAKLFDSPDGLLTIAVQHDRPEMLGLLLDLRFDPDERVRLGGLEEVVYSWGSPLWQCAAHGRFAMAEMLLKSGADPNAPVYASGSPVYSAYGQRDWSMVELLRRYGGMVDAATVAHYRQTELARQMIADEPAGTSKAATLVEDLLWGAACGGDPEIVRMALERIEWPRDDPRWYRILEQPLRIWNHMDGHCANPSLDRGTYVTCFRLILERCDPNIRHPRFGRTILHDVAGSRDHLTPEERVAFAMLLLDAGARLDVRDDLLLSTPLGWACRWGRIELVKLSLERGADPVEAGAEPWATPHAWAQKMGHSAVLALLRSHGA
ncbi:MAG TPA: ankyrin repeat domain-containing protein [Bryobacteraceae bacterium]|nr:ankyrin repeat domain-containing protein [Bryobacteraceae bacterium]